MLGHGGGGYALPHHSGFRARVGSWYERGGEDPIQCWNQLEVELVGSGDGVYNIKNKG